MKFYALCFFLLAQLCMSCAEFFAQDRDVDNDDEVFDDNPKPGEDFDSFALRQRIRLNAIRLHNSQHDREPVRLRLVKP